MDLLAWSHGRTRVTLSFPTVPSAPPSESEKCRFNNVNGSHLTAHSFGVEREERYSRLAGSGSCYNLTPSARARQRQHRGLGEPLRTPPPLPRRGVLLDAQGEAAEALRVLKEVLAG